MGIAQGDPAGSSRSGNRLTRFVAADHRYVFLGTSAIALVGMWLSSQPRTEMSFLAGVYALEVVMYYLLFAWVVVSGVALLNKLIKWRDYATTSPFVRPGARKAERIASYVVVAITAVLFVDRVVMGFIAVAQAAALSETNPQGFLPGMVYMLFAGKDIFIKGITTTVQLAVFGTVIAFFLALLLVFLRLQQIDRPDNDLVRFLKVVGCGFAKVYSAVVRGTPMMVQSLLIYFAGFAVLRGTGMSASQIGAIWSTFVAGLVTISLNSTAYMMEVLRGAMTKVVFPQGIKNAVPALSNELVVNIKDSSVLSVIGVFDLMFSTTTVAGIYYRQLEVYVIATICYLILTMIASKLLSMLARRLDAPAKGPVLSTSDVAVTMGVTDTVRPAGANASPNNKQER